MRLSPWLLALLPAVSLGQQPFASYDYIQVGYTEADVYGVDGGGFGIEASAGVGQRFYLFGAYTVIEADDFANTDLTETTFGVGTHHDLLDNLSLFTGLGYADLKLDTSLGSASDDGFTLRAGLRFKPSARAELRVGLERVDLDVLGRDTGITAGADFFVGDAISFAVNYREFDYVETLGVAARFHFGGKGSRRVQR